MRYENAIVIAAPAAVVWDLTADLPRWPELTPTMKRVEPLDPLPLHVGLRARIKQPLLPEAVWTVTELDPGRSFAWATSRSGLTITATHRTEEADGGCRNILGVELSGRGERRYALLSGPGISWAIKRENRGFKEAAERAA